MKYLRGYLVAAIIAAITWALTQFAAAHTQLMDMFYPYMTRIVQTALAQWSSGVQVCLWQVLLVMGIGAVLVSVALMVIFRWKPVQWFGWVLTCISVMALLNVGLYTLNNYAGSIADDVRIDDSDYSITALEDAALYYMDRTNSIVSLAAQEKGDFAQLSEQAAEGFKVLTYERLFPVFAGSTVPVKELGWSGIYSLLGVTGKTVGLTGEAAVNPNVPGPGLPFHICREMACRMSIVKDSDANFAAFLACEANSNIYFQYAGYLMAYRHCYNALAATNSSAGQAAATRLKSNLSSVAQKDLEAYNDFLGSKADHVSDETVKLLVNWHIETVVLPSQAENQQQENLFDPLDESDERLSGLLNPTE